MDFPLSDVQMMYLMGMRARPNAHGYESPADLTGVPCHAYYELCAPFVDADKLQRAWEAVIAAHPMLRAAYSPEGLGAFLARPYSDRVPVIDLSAYDAERASQELLSIRSLLGQRVTHHEDGQVAGLALVVLDALNVRVLFDASLVACDVRSLYRILCEVHDVYAGMRAPDELADLDEDALVALLRSRAAPPAESDTAFWHARIQKIPLSGFNLQCLAFFIDEETLAQRRYRSLDAVLHANEARSLLTRSKELGTTPYAAILSCVSHALCDLLELERLVALVPFFSTPGTNEAPDVVGDFTDIGVVELDDKEPTLLVHEANEELRRAQAHAARCTRIVLAELAIRRIVPHIVFTTVPGVRIVGAGDLTALGHLSYSRSQTPQVALDVQVEDFGEGFLVHWVYPEGLFDQFSLEECFERFFDSCIEFGG